MEQKYQVFSFLFIGLYSVSFFLIDYIFKKKNRIDGKLLKSFLYYFMTYYFFDYIIGFMYGYIYAVKNNASPVALPFYFPIITFSISEFLYIFLYKLYKKFLFILPGAFLIIILYVFFQMYINPAILRIKTYGMEGLIWSLFYLVPIIIFLVKYLFERKKFIFDYEFLKKFFSFWVNYECFRFVIELLMQIYQVINGVDLADFSIAFDVISIFISSIFYVILSRIFKNRDELYYKISTISIFSVLALYGLWRLLVIYVLK